MNTDHEGSLTTIHANTPRDGLSRLEAMCLQTGVDLPVHVIREMISSAVNMIVQLSRFSDGSRKVTYITEMHGQVNGEIQSTDLFRYVQTGVDENGKVQGVFAPTGNLPTFYDEFEAKGWPVSKDVFTKGAVPLDASGEPDLRAVEALQASTYAPAPQEPMPPAPQEPMPPAPQEPMPPAPQEPMPPAPQEPMPPAPQEPMPPAPQEPMPPAPQEPMPPAPQEPMPPAPPAV